MKSIKPLPSFGFVDSHIRQTAMLVLMASLVVVFTSPRVFAEAKNDNMFRPPQSVRKAIDFDGKGFIIQGKRVFLASGSMHYARVPEALWRQRLMPFKRAGFNCVETYVFWNFQEPQRGKFNFTGRGDLDQFLKLAHELGMYVIVRVGPYDCAEWNSGGYPLWLRYTPGLEVRRDNPAFMKAVTQYFNKLLPIVARNQVSHGGSVVMVQLENEDPEGWGTSVPNSYFKKLKQLADDDGINVITFFSGVHHGRDPAGPAPWNDADRTSPWFTTEFWSVWYSTYGNPSEQTLERFRERTWRILAFGGSGYNIYMLHGGTNFGYSNDNELAATYDYGAAIGQTGDLRDLYYAWKRINCFAHSFPAILENSVNTTSKYKDFATGGNAYARTSPAGTIVFLGSTATLKNGDKINVRPGDMVPLLMDTPIDDVWTIDQSTGPIFAVTRDGKITTVVMFGEPGEKVALNLSAKGEIHATGRRWQVTDRKTRFAAQVPAHGPDVYLAHSDDRTLRVVVESTELSRRTWVVPDKTGGKAVVVGPPFLGDVKYKDNEPSDLATVRPLGSTVAAAKWFGNEVSAIKFAATGKVSQPSVARAKLTDWQALGAIPKSSSRQWQTSKAPLPMSSGGNQSAYCWYRAQIDVPAAGTYTLVIRHVSDKAVVLCNGVQAKPSLQPDAFELTCRKGVNELTMLAVSTGRGKFLNHRGPLRPSKGIFAPVQVYKGSPRTVAIKQWRYQLGSGPVADLRHMPGKLDLDTTRWKTIAADKPTPNPKHAAVWFHADLPGDAHKHHGLVFTDVPGNCFVYVNGKRIGRRQPGGALKVNLSWDWRPGKANSIDLFVEDPRGDTIALGPVRFYTFADETLEHVMDASDWRFRGGLIDWRRSEGWSKFTQPLKLPCFYKTTFATPVETDGGRFVRRVNTSAITSEVLPTGSVWLNGHNLGRYPDRVMPMGLWLPRCWMKPAGGDNELVIFDMTGANGPTGVKIVEEEAASRQDVTLTRSTPSR